MNSMDLLMNARTFPSEVPQKNLFLLQKLGRYPQYHVLFEIRPPGFLYSPVTRNVHGLTFFHTPLYIGTDTGANFTPNFTNLPGIYPNIGDDSTWMLVVAGPALMKEVFVLDSAWADYVFDPNYKLTPIEQAESFIKTHRHLPNLPPASALAKTGVPLERTEEQITKQLEEAMLYIGQLHDEVKELKSEVEELKNQKGK
jgi:hypothetical protein